MRRYRWERSYGFWVGWRRDRNGFMRDYWVGVGHWCLHVIWDRYPAKEGDQT